MEVNTGIIEGKIEALEELKSWIEVELKYVITIEHEPKKQVRQAGHQKTLFDVLEDSYPQFRSIDYRIKQRK